MSLYSESSKCFLKVKVLVTQSCLTVTPWTRACQVPLYRNSLVKNTGVGRHSLLQEIFRTQGSNPRSVILQADSLLSEPPGKPASYTAS